MPDGFSSLIDLLGDDASVLPDGFFSDDATDVGEATMELTKISFWLDLLSRLLTDGLRSSFKLFLSLCVLVILSAIFGAVGRSLSSEALSGAVSFCSATVIMATVIHIQADYFERVELFFERLVALMGAMIPITGAVWAMGGNVSTASVGTSALYVFLSVCEGICGKSIVPVCCVFTALALCNTLSPEMGLRGFSNALKKIYTFFLGMIMTVLLASITASTALSSAADSTSARAAKLISSNIIPVVGASVGDTLRTIATSVKYLKSVVGISGIIFILLLLLPVLISLIMTRLSFMLAGGFAEMLGCDTESRFLSELGGIYGIMIAVASMSAVMFIFALTIFSKTVVAIA